MPKSDESNSSSRLRLVHDRARRVRELRAESERALREWENALDVESIASDGRITLPDIHVHLPSSPDIPVPPPEPPRLLHDRILSGVPLAVRIPIALLVAGGGGSLFAQLLDWGIKAVTGK
jgi:hypothetical protein